MVIYTLQSILIFAKRSEEAREFLFIRQNVVMFCLHFVAFMVLYLQMNQSQILFFYGEQALYLAATLIFFRHLYPKASKLAINNMCMLITIGFIMVTRLSYDQSVKQFQICVIGTVIALIVPWLISKLKFITKFAVVYAINGDKWCKTVTDDCRHYPAAIGVCQDYLCILHCRNVIKIDRIFADCQNYHFGGCPCTDPCDLHRPWKCTDLFYDLSDHALCGNA